MKYLAFQEKQESQREGYCAFDQVGLHTPGFAKPEIDKVWTWLWKWVSKELSM